MIEIRNILCPIDFSDHSRRALDHAIVIARKYKSTVSVLHVYSAALVAAYAPGTPDVPPVVWTSADRDGLLADLARFIETESVPGIPVTPVIREGIAAVEIVKQAAEADLLVIGTHGRSGFERLFLGSVTEKVLRKSACPVLTVPAHAPDAVPAAPVLFQRILCPVDFSDTSLDALAYAMSMAREAEAHLTVLHVMTYGPIEAPDMYETIISDERVSLAEYRRRSEDRVRERLNELVREAGVSVETLISRGRPSHDVLRIAKEQESDLVVMGVQGRGAADLMFFGSTTHHVVREAACPVLTLRRRQSAG